MTTATDRLVVSALDAKDAQDIARRQWEAFGFRVLAVLEVVPGRELGRWRVEATVEVVRP